MPIDETNRKELAQLRRRITNACLTSEDIELFKTLLREHATLANTILDTLEEDEDLDSQQAAKFAEYADRLQGKIFTLRSRVRTERMLNENNENHEQEHEHNQKRKSAKRQ